MPDLPAAVLPSRPPGRLQSFQRRPGLPQTACSRGDVSMTGEERIRGTNAADAACHCSTSLVPCCLWKLKFALGHEQLSDVRHSLLD